MHCSFAFTTQIARNAPPPPPTQIGSPLSFATANSRWSLGHTPAIAVAVALGEGDAVEVVVEGGVGAPDEVEVGVTLAWGVEVAVGVGGTAVGVEVGVETAVAVAVAKGIATQRLAESMHAEPLNLVRLTILLLYVTPLTPCAQQYVPVGLVLHGESAAQFSIAANILQTSVSLPHRGG